MGRREEDQAWRAMIAANLAGVIDAILTTERDRNRRCELIAHHVDRAISLGQQRERKGEVQDVSD